MSDNRPSAIYVIHNIYIFTQKQCERRNYFHFGCIQIYVYTSYIHTYVCMQEYQFHVITLMLPTKNQ